VEASFALAFGVGATGNRVDCAPRNTSLTQCGTGPHLSVSQSGRWSRSTTPTTW
jgi:hypothetical protein